MTPRDIDRVFGRSRLRMRTGDHVEVFREAAAPGERRCYTKRFLATPDGDLREWTEREWRILARMVGHGIGCVPEVVQFDRGSGGQPPLVTTFDAGVTVDHWATLLPVQRDGCTLAHVFQDCAHWWALAHHLLRALDEVHGLGVIHLDLKADNVCIPLEPADFRPDQPAQVLRPLFARLALIDFAFSLVAGEDLGSPLPIGWQQEFDYQSPRLLGALRAGASGELQPTRELDWRCDMYSLAALLDRYLPRLESQGGCLEGAGWTQERHAEARALIVRIRDSHAQETAQARPHAALCARTEALLREADLAESLARGWGLADPVSEASIPHVATPVTRLAPRPAAGPREEAQAAAPASGAGRQIAHTLRRVRAHRRFGAGAVIAALLATAVVLGPWAWEKVRPSRGGSGTVARAQSTAHAKYEARGRQILSSALPRAAVAAEKEVAWVLFLAGAANSRKEDDEVARAASRIPASPDLLGSGTDHATAEKLHEQARKSLAAGRDAREPLPLQLRAFGADPNDAQVAGQLALIHTRLAAPSAETSRQLAMYSLARGRWAWQASSAEGWVTLAIASALARREQDAMHALFVMAALAKDGDEACRMAIDAWRRHGDRMKGPAAALLHRVRGRSSGAVPKNCKTVGAGADRVPKQD